MCDIVYSDVSLLNFCPNVLSIEKSMVLKSTLINGLMLICPFNSSSTHVMKSDISKFGAYIFVVEMYS